MTTREEESAFSKVRIGLGNDDNAYVTAIYKNGENGPRSEGYVRHREDGTVDVRATILAAQKAAARDFPGLPQFIEFDED